MAVYRIILKKSAVKELEAIPKRDLTKIVERIHSLADEPRPQGVEKLSAQERYRIRQGGYRIVSSIEDDVLTVCVVKVGHRREVSR